MIIKFYNPRCPHCINFAPVFESTAIDAEESESTYFFFRVNVTENSKSIKNFGIDFIPDVRVSFIFVNYLRLLEMERKLPKCHMVQQKILIYGGFGSQC